MAVNKRKVLEAARKHAQKGAKEKALKEYNTLLKADPRDAKLHLEIGDAYRRWGQIDDAVAQYVRVADQYTQEGFDARAVAVYKQILNLDPKRYSAFVSLGDLYQRMGLDSEAVQALQTAADGYHKEGEKRQALDLLRKMATLDPSNTTSRMKVADLLRQEGLEDEALSEYDAVAEELVRQKSTEAVVNVYERILELRDDRADVHVSMARTLIALKRAAEAEAHAKRALELEADSAEHRELLCDIYKGLGRDADLTRVGRDLARIYRERGDEDRAREIVQRIPELGEFEVQPSGADDIPAVPPAPPRVDADLGPEPVDGLAEEDDELLADDELLDDEEFLEGGDLDEVDLEPTGAQLTELVTLEDPVAEVPLETFEPTPAPADAPTRIAAAAETPGDSEQMLAEASVYLRYGKRDQAIENLRAVLDQDPDHPAALEKLGEAMAAGDDNEQAVTLWMRAAGVARDAGDEAAVTRICDRVAEFDPDQATLLMPAPAEADAPAADAPATAEAPATADTPGTGNDAEVDIAEFEVEIDLEMDLEGSPDEEDSPEPTFEGSADATVLALPDEESSEGADSEELSFGSDENELSVGEGSGPGEPSHASPDDDPDITPLDVRPDADDEDSAEPDPVGVVLDDAAAQTNDGSFDDEDRAEPLASQSSTTTQQVEEELDEAEFYFEQGMFDEAEQLYRKVLRIAPNHPSALLRLGELAVRRGADPSEETSGQAESVSNPDALSSPTLGQSDVPDVDEPEVDESKGAEDRPSAFEVLSAHEGMDRVDQSFAGPKLAAPAEQPQALDLPDDFEDLAGDLEGLQVPGAASETQPELPPAPDLDDVHDLSDTVGEESTASELPAPAGDGFDLAAELRDSLGETTSGLSGVQGVPAGVSSTVEEGFESIFRDFKRGVSEALSEGDVDTRYDLGIAYKEMGLIEDALAEFQLCVGDPGHRFQALHMLALCTLELGRHGDAVHHLQQALSLPDALDAQRAGIYFDLGRAYRQAGDLDAARDAFESVRTRDPSFPDLDAQIAALDRPEPGVEEPDEQEHLESFDDLVAEVEGAVEGAVATPSTPEKLESFEDWIEDEGEAPAASPDHPTPKPDPPPEPHREPERAPADEPEPETTTPRKKRISFV